MGKVDRLRNRVEPFAALFWALGTVLANPARRPGITPPPYTKHMVTVGSILNEEMCPFPLFLSRYVIYLWGESTQNHNWKPTEKKRK